MAVVFAGWNVYAAPTEAPEEPDTADALTETEPESSPESEEQTLEDYSHLLLERKPVPVTTPVRKKKKGKQKAPLLGPKPEEGMMILHRRCRLGRDEQSGYMVVLFAKAVIKSRKLLPCQLLEEMEKLTAENPDAMFHITGETFAYKEEGYLLIRKLELAKELSFAPSSKPEPPKGDTQPAGDATSKPASALTETDGDASSDDVISKLRDVSSDEVIQQLKADRAGRPVIAPSIPREHVESPEPSISPAMQKPLPPGRGDLAVNRIVRIVRMPAKQWYLLRFEADNTLQEPPLRLLPCLRLQLADSWLKGGKGREILFHVSGEVTRYKGRRYFLLRKLIPTRNMGQF